MKKIIIKTIKCFFIVFITLLLFELSYRFYIIDFYKSSLTSLNTSKMRENKNVDLLVFGDSFSANTNGYISNLQNYFPNKTILNASVPGIGIKQVNIMAHKRITETHPKNILIQVFVGNDLLDIENLSNWKDISLLRNLYWKTTNSFLSLRYLNQNFSFLKNEKKGLHLDNTFSKDLYNERYKLYFEANNSFLYNSVVLEKDFMERYIEWKKQLIEVIHKIPKNIKVYLLFIPDCSQVNDNYLNNMNQINGAFKNKTLYNSVQYPFYKQAKNDLKLYSNVEFLNPLEYFRKKDTKSYRLYHYNDPHFNENGHKELSLFLKQKIFFN